MHIHPGHVQILVRLLVLAVMIGGCGAPAVGPGSKVPTPLLTPTAQAATEIRGEPVHPTRTAATLPADFAFIFDTNPCGIGRLDTFRDTFTQGQRWEHRKTVPIELSAKELDRIYQKMREIDIFAYPRRYEIVLPPDQLRSGITPAPNYYLKVRSGGRTREISWHDEITDPNPPEAQRLRELMRLLENTMRSQPEVRALPEAGIGCA